MFRVHFPSLAKHKELPLWPVMTPRGEPSPTVGTVC
jgi:hypothetical protein